MENIEEKRVQWGVLQRTNATTNSFIKKSGCYNEHRC